MARVRTRRGMFDEYVPFVERRCINGSVVKHLRIISEPIVQVTLVKYARLLPERRCRSHRGVLHLLRAGTGLIWSRETAGEEREREREEVMFGITDNDGSSLRL